MNWRVGTKLGRTLYEGEQLVGMMDTVELAARVVDAMNGAEVRKLKAALEMCKASEGSWHMAGPDRPVETCRICQAIAEALR